MKFNYYVLQDPTSQDLIGVDPSSGGYPFHAGCLSDVNFFLSLEEAEKYQRMFPAYRIKIFSYYLSDLTYDLY